MPNGYDYLPDVHRMTDQVYQLHMRLVLMVGEVWAEQILASMRFYSTAGYKSYLDLVQDAVDIAIKLSVQGKT